MCESVYECMCVCVYVCMCVCVDVCMCYMCMCVHMCESVYVCMCVCVYVCMCVCGWLLLLMILHLLMLLLLAYILLLPYCQSQRYYCTIHSLIVIGLYLLLTATTMHTAPTELIQEKRQHQCHYPH